MSTFVTASALVGVDPRPVRVETTLSGGRGQFIIVGLPDAAVRESRERVRSALKASGFTFPSGRVVVSLSPADLPKSGALFDLPVALSIVQATEGLGGNAGGYVAMGELSLHGDLKPARHSIVAACVAEGVGGIALVPSGSTIPGVVSAKAVSVDTLRQAVAVIRGTSGGGQISVPPSTVRGGGDLSEIRGQHAARRALEIAAAGGHHMLMIGPPGGGKSMLASTLPSLLPKLGAEGEREVALVRAAMGAEDRDVAYPPFRAPHHSISMAALVGGGAGVPKPGEVTRAHRGVLFLDELGEFPPAVLDALRQPMESESIVVSRQAASVRFPSSIQVVGASNPCPCGYLGDRIKGCTCTAARLDKYRSRLSGPLVDRFDVRIVVDRVRPQDLAGVVGEPSVEVRKRVSKARRLQIERGALNRSLTADALAATEDGNKLLRMLQTEPSLASLTARGWNRIRRVARTIADLGGESVVTDIHVKEASEMRGDIT